jgi:tellurite resistance protein TerC
VDLGVVAIVLQLIFLEGILSIDNAAVLGAMVRHLPKDQPIPWPRGLRFLRRGVDPLFGPQRMAALKAGLLGAYIGRGAMLFLASLIIQHLWLRALGAAYLLKLGMEHLGREAKAADGGGQARATGDPFWTVVLKVELVDLAFSLDNVVVAVALSPEFWVVMLGVGLGIITMRFAAGLFTLMIAREPILASAAYLLVLIIGLEQLAADFAGLHLHEMVKFAISVLAILASVAYARWRPLWVLAPLLRAIGRGLAAANGIIDGMLWPLAWLGRRAARLVRRAIPGRAAAGLPPRD